MSFRQAPPSGPRSQPSVLADQNPHSMDLRSPSSETDSTATIDMRNSMVSNGPDDGPGGMQGQSRPLYYLSTTDSEDPWNARKSRKNRIYPKNHNFSYEPFFKRQPDDTDPMEIGQKECDILKKAIRDGSGFIIGIRISHLQSHKFQQRFNSPIAEWSEDQLLSILINALHLLISRHDIGLDYAAIVGSGIECTENKRAELKYEVTVTLPTITADAPGSIRCACVCVISPGLNLVQVDVTCIVDGKLPTLPKEYEFQPTGTTATRAYLGSVGYLSLLSLMKTVLETNMETAEAVFRHAMQPGSEFEQVSQDPNSIGPAVQDATVQCLAVLNIDHDPRTVRHVVDRDAGAEPAEWQVVVTVPPVNQGRQSIVVTFNGRYKYLYQGSRRKQVARSSNMDWLFPTFFEGRILAACANPPQVIPPFRRFSCHDRDARDSEFGIVQYLMRCFKERGFVCTESIVREAIEMTRRGGRVQLLLADVWNRQLAFPTQNKDLLLDLVEDTVSTLFMLSRAKFERQLKFVVDSASPEWPHTTPTAALSIKSEDGHALASLDRDSAGNNILSLRLSTWSMGYNHHAWPASVVPLGGINLKCSAAPIQNCNDEGNAGASGDAGEQNGGGKEASVEDEGRSDSDVEGDFGEDDSCLASNSGLESHDDWEEEDPDGSDNASGSAMDSGTEIRASAMAGSDAEADGASRSVMPLKRQNASSQQHSMKRSMTAPPGCKQLRGSS